MINAVDTCVGCGKPTNGYQFVGIGNPEDFPSHTGGDVVIGVDGKGREAFPICQACHHEPPRPLKMHYVERARVHDALRAAGSSGNIGGPLTSAPATGTRSVESK